MYVKAKKLEPRRLAGPPVEHVVHDRERSFLDLLVEVYDDCLQRRGGGVQRIGRYLIFPVLQRTRIEK